MEDYEKPVILTFDDGWENMYIHLFPLLKQYQVKATIFVVCDFFGWSHYLNEEQALEMQESGFVSLQSHAATHTDLTKLSLKHQEYEFAYSQMIMTRLFGKEPLVIAYPYGGSYGETEQLASQYFRFGVKMVSGKSYNTSDDPMRVYRFWPERKTQLWEYEKWLKKAFPDAG